mmetsp:Transcript_60874/g.199327  ORF Transcript_60874/g.199327 Transcript_60874/m.199327 type:complete len:256 (+) Transcript_60874:1496-2263(+)
MAFVGLHKLLDLLVVGILECTQLLGMALRRVAQYPLQRVESRRQLRLPRLHFCQIRIVFLVSKSQSLHVPHMLRGQLAKCVLDHLQPLSCGEMLLRGRPQLLQFMAVLALSSFVSGLRRLHRLDLLPMPVRGLPDLLLEILQMFGQGGALCQRELHLVQALQVLLLGLLQGPQLPRKALAQLGVQPLELLEATVGARVVSHGTVARTLRLPPATLHAPHAHLQSAGEALKFGEPLSGERRRSSTAGASVLDDLPR